MQLEHQAGAGIHAVAGEVKNISWLEETCVEECVPRRVVVVAGEVFSQKWGVDECV
jgi:hypothetical protein